VFRGCSRSDKESSCLGIEGELPLFKRHLGGQRMFVNLTEFRNHALHKNVAAAELFGGFVDNFLCALCIRRVALYQKTFGTSVTEEGQSLLGFILARQVVDSDFANAFLRQL
jgi:hypothetical protein